VKAGFGERGDGGILRGMIASRLAQGGATGLGEEKAGAIMSDIDSRGTLVLQTKKSLPAQ
jgi:hypothetical protein